MRGKPSSRKPSRASGSVEPLAHDADHDLVGDERAGLHVLLRLAAHLGALGDGRAQHLTGRDVRQPEVRHDALGLGALAGPGAAEKDHIALWCHLVSYLRKPS